MEKITLTVQHRAVAAQSLHNVQQLLNY